MKTHDVFFHHRSHFVDQDPAQRTTTMEAHEPLGKKNRRAKKASTKTQQARQEALRKGLQAPRTDTPPMKEVSWEEYRRAKKEEKKLERHHAKLKREGDKKPYLQERGNCLALGKMRDDVSASSHGVVYANPFSSSSSRCSGGDGPGL